MSVLWYHNPDWLSSADLIAAAYTNVWTSYTGTPTVTASGYSGTAGLTASAPASLTKVLTAADGVKAAVTARIKLSSYPAARTTLLTILDNTGVEQVSVVLETSGKVTLRRGPLSELDGEDIATSIAAVGTGTFFTLGLRTKLGASDGSAFVYVNGVIKASRLVGQTQYTTNPWDRIRVDLDSNVIAGHVVMSDGDTGIADNPVVYVRYPTANGADQEWIPLSGTIYSSIDDPTQDGDTTYVGGGGSTKVTAFHDLALGLDPTTQVVKGLRLSQVIRESSTLGPTATPYTKLGTTRYLDTARTIGATYQLEQTEWPTNPSTLAAWTEADIAAAEFGLQRNP